MFWAFDTLVLVLALYFDEMDVEVLVEGMNDEVSDTEEVFDD